MIKLERDTFLELLLVLVLGFTLFFIADIVADESTPTPKPVEATPTIVIGE